MTEQGRTLYGELAHCYDLLYSWKDYKKEADKLKIFIHKYKKSTGTDLLEVACGTGNHLQFFTDDFNCTATDISVEMLAVTRKKNPGVTTRQADMINFDLGERFDVILCLFSSIGYVKTYENLRKTLENFSRHLKSGGVVLIEPWFTRASFHPGRPGLTTYQGDDIKIARANTSRVEDDLSIMDMHYLVAEKDRDVRYFADHHEMGLFEIETTLAYMKEAGLQAKFLKNGVMKDRGLYAGVKKGY